MVVVPSGIDGREAFARKQWGDAYELLARCESLDADDLERLATAAYLVGKDRESAHAWERAHLERLRAAESDQAARCAFWLGTELMLRGEMAQAGGWLARAERLVEELGGRTSLRGLLLVPGFLGALDAGEAATARDLADQMMAIAGEFTDLDLKAMAILAAGQAALALGETRRAMKLFDEVMVAVTTGDVSPIAAGIVYCAVVDACMQVCDLRRAAEWTDVLSAWCDAQPDLVPYRGQCLVHRSQVLQARGNWTKAMSEAERARRHLSEPPHPALGFALYQVGELHRLRGELPEAEQSYRAASEHGRDPAPGLALLRLAQGNVSAAVAAVRRMTDENPSTFDQPAVLSAAVEVLLSTDDVQGARAAASELAEMARSSDLPLVRAMASFAQGTVLLAAGNGSGALAHLRQACAGWRELVVAYECARARVQIALALRNLGDHDAAQLELAAARAAFDRLGAVPDVAKVDRLLEPAPVAASATTGLTDRECEVLRLVAGGKTNREIASALVISEHTVARHLQNIFLKLGLSSRAAATAYAYEHGLV
jgi:ATP/maltotriose-dependent transcriptional regulator MalT